MGANAGAKLASVAWGTRLQLGTHGTAGSALPRGGCAWTRRAGFRAWGSATRRWRSRRAGFRAWPSEARPTGGPVRTRLACAAQPHAVRRAARAHTHRSAMTRRRAIQPLPARSEAPTSNAQALEETLRRHRKGAGATQAVPTAACAVARCTSCGAVAPCHSCGAAGRGRPRPGRLCAHSHEIAPVRWRTKL